MLDPLPADGAQVYLTDTVESPHAVPPGHLPLGLKRLGQEHKRALKVKAKTPVLVCIGNPPYDRQTIATNGGSGEARKGGWVRYGEPENGKRGILQDFIDPLTTSGQAKHAKNLYNDYVYFWRWALWKVFDPDANNQGVPGHGIVSFITASSYLRGPGFAGMRKVMRQTFDDLWIIDLEGGNLGARKTENVFAIQTPVAIAIGVRYGQPKPDQPASVHYTRIEGTQKEKLAVLEKVLAFGDLTWSPCPSGWNDPFQPIVNSPFFDWPLLTHLFPWQENGTKVGRTWPVAEACQVLLDRWEALMRSKQRKPLFKDSPTGRKLGVTAVALPSSSAVLPSLSSLPATEPIARIERYAFRSFDRQWLIADSRLIDRPSPSLWRVHGPDQVYITSLLTEVLGEGPSAVATALIPDLHHFRGSFGGAHVIPLWRDTAATKPNVTAGVLEKLGATYSRSVSAAELFAYCYGVLASPKYVRRFWEELRTPGPHIPITSDVKLFEQMVALGRRLLWVHTYGERFIPPGTVPGQVPVGQAKCTVGTPSDPSQYPEQYSYDASMETLRVGTGVFEGVRPEVWNFSVSGLQVVKSWLDYRMRKRAGKKSSPLDDLRPAKWEFDDELLDLLWVLDATVDLLLQVASTLDAILASNLLPASDFPDPSAAEQRAPGAKLAQVITLFDDEAEDGEEEDVDDAEDQDE